MGALSADRGRQDTAGFAALDPVALRRFGITRLGDLTDLDIIGVPVWFAARPNSRGLAVSQGKGLNQEQAQISAVMEAIEGGVAEDTQRHVREYGSVRSLASRGLSVVPLDDLARVDWQNLDPDRERAWVQGYSVRDQHTVFAPYELVGMDYRMDFPWDRQAFHMSSQGLAAGFDFDRTVLHGLLELVENDACFLVDALATRSLGLRPVAFPSGLCPALDQLVARVEAAGLSARFFDLTSSNGIPVIMASLPRSVAGQEGPGMRVVAGVACRLDRGEAAIAALLEAVQSRLTDISGARDDLTPQRYVGDRNVPEKRLASDLSGTELLPLDLSSHDQAGAVWQRLAHHLFARGVEDIYIFPLDTAAPEIRVVRVLARGLSAAGASLNRLSAGALDGFLG
ncbi:YcaO-domain protein [Rhizobium sp. PDO1-076]|uniref:YcaO-like family protein n=1 Tax=Rhizobium sp. PDO1-076 TaxID=1125979 RepID=UPI00024E2749|nr:YcaO-like family protein [Rhizobium sp. PDO1-076]EHS52395.1 YcaO-domain protein [Rhizobium sp. PDO1-076]